jgi:hypothetical protein
MGAAHSGRRWIVVLQRLEFTPTAARKTPEGTPSKASVTRRVANETTEVVNFINTSLNGKTE